MGLAVRGPSLPLAMVVAGPLLVVSLVTGMAASRRQSVGGVGGVASRSARHWSPVGRQSVASGWPVVVAGGGRSARRPALPRTS